MHYEVLVQNSTGVVADFWLKMLECYRKLLEELIAKVNMTLLIHGKRTGYKLTREV